MKPVASCSPARPWGVHLSLADDNCPRCGWTAREQIAAALPDGDPPIGSRKPEPN